MTSDWSNIISGLGDFRVVTSGVRSGGGFWITGGLLELGGFTWVLISKGLSGIGGEGVRDCEATNGSPEPCAGSFRQLWGLGSGGVLLKPVPSLDDV
jgi:hypothetical protein